MEISCPWGHKQTGVASLTKPSWRANVRTDQHSRLESTGEPGVRQGPHRARGNPVRTRPLPELLEEDPDQNQADGSTRPELGWWAISCDFSRLGTCRPGSRFWS